MHEHTRSIQSFFNHPLDIPEHSIRSSINITHTLSEANQQIKAAEYFCNLFESNPISKPRSPKSMSFFFETPVYSISDLHHVYNDFDRALKAANAPGRNQIQSSGDENGNQNQVSRSFQPR